MGNTEKPDSSAINQLNRTYSEEMLKMTRWMRYVRKPSSYYNRLFRY